jgi:hypothetical protein
MRQTSESSPLRVDFLPQEAAGLPGRIGLTIAPGKKGQGLDGEWDRDLDVDLARLRDVYRASMLVSLCEPHELTFLSIPELWERARAAGLQVEAHPWVDGGVPPHPAWLFPLIRALLQAAAEGRTVVIHCRGGLGRSGLVAACALVARGKGAAEAMAIVRAARRGAIERDAQEAFVQAFEVEWPSAR